MGYLLFVTLIQAFSFSLIGEYLAGHVDSYFAVLVRVVLARADAWINPPRPQDTPVRSRATLLRCVFELFWLTWKTRRSQRRQPPAANPAQEDGSL